MNLLSVILDWHSSQSDLIVQEEYFSYGPISLHVQRTNIGDKQLKNFVFNKEQGILCGVIGYISNIADLRKKLIGGGNRDDVELLAELYLKEGESSFSLIEGFFTVFIWDFTRQKGYIFQDENGFQTPLLYISTQGKSLFCNSLRILLKSGEFPRKLNLQAARDFLYSRVIIPNESTLIEGVCKLLPGQIIIIDWKAKSMKVQTIRRNEIRFSSDDAKKNLIASIEEETKKLSALAGTSDIGTALSSGFDTNLILFFLNKQYFKKIVAVTIGGKKVNEISSASCCAATYEKVRHVAAVVEDSRLLDFPDIVWRSEGSIFESGLFLANELGKVLQKETISVVFLGDGADQQLNPFRLTEGAVKSLIKQFKHRLKQKIIPLRKFWRLLKHKKIYVSKYPLAIHKLKKPMQLFVYDTKKDYILKKCGVILNSYGIQPLYPFLSRKTLALAKSLSPGECRRKKFYRKEVKKILASTVSQYLRKIGGATDIEYLCQDKKSLFEELLHKDLIKTILPMLDDKQKKEMLEDIPSYTESLAHLLYIYLFNELFISGKYDSLFNNTGINLTLGDFFD